MPYDVLAVLRHLKYMEYVRQEVSLQKQYAAEPRKYEIHNHELFESWKKNAERVKEAHEANTKGNQQIEKGTSPNETPQAELTAGFLKYYKEQVNDKAFSTIYWEMCTGHTMTYSQKHIRRFADNGEFVWETKSEYERALDGLDNLINFMGMIMENYIV